MKKTAMSYGASLTYKPLHPERTAFRNSQGGSLDFDVVFQEWPNRASMLKTCDMQGRTDTKNPWVPFCLGDYGVVCITEGPEPQETSEDEKITFKFGGWINNPDA